MSLDFAIRPRAFGLRALSAVWLSYQICGVADAPPRLVSELAELIRFKTATLTDIGFQRIGVWNEETTAQKIEHFGLMFGALAASPRGAVEGHGIPLKDLSFAMLILPRVWDWYVQWRERRRGFFTRWECDMLRNAMALVRADTGWLRQHPALAAHLVPVSGLISTEEVAAARDDWQGACDILHAHAAARVKEVERVARVHRDPFEPILPILPILEAQSPVAEYLRIADEILKFRPAARCYPRRRRRWRDPTSSCDWAFTSGFARRSFGN